MRKPSVLAFASLLLSAHASTVTLKFATEALYDSGGYAAKAVSVADLNHDGIPDIVITNCSSVVTTTCPGEGVVGVLLGSGRGNFQKATTYNSGGIQPQAVAIADVNHDGVPDIVVANCGPSGGTCSEGSAGMVSVLLGNGDGTFRPAVSYSSGGTDADSVALADVNQDGNPDIVVSNQCESYNAGCSATGSVAVLFGNGDGTFGTAVSYSSGGAFALAVALGDVNGDGIPDVIVVNDWTRFTNTNGLVGVLLANGDGTFRDAVTYATGGAYSDSVAVADVNGDGKPDLLVGNDCRSSTNCTGGGLSVLLGNGDGTFQGAVVTPTISTFSIAVADMNGDGRPDLVFATSSSGTQQFGVTLGNGDGTFQTPTYYGTVTPTGSVPPQLEMERVFVR